MYEFLVPGECLYSVCVLLGVLGLVIQGDGIRGLAGIGVLGYCIGRG